MSQVIILLLVNDFTNDLLRVLGSEGIEYGPIAIDRNTKDGIRQVISSVDGGFDPFMRQGIKDDQVGTAEDADGRAIEASNCIAPDG